MDKDFNTDNFKSKNYIGIKVDDEIDRKIDNYFTNKKKESKAKILHKYK